MDLLVEQARTRSLVRSLEGDPGGLYEFVHTCGTPPALHPSTLQSSFFLSLSLSCSYSRPSVRNKRRPSILVHTLVTTRLVWVSSCFGVTYGGEERRLEVRKSS